MATLRVPNIIIGDELPDYINPDKFTFTDNACTGYIGDNTLSEIVIPKKYGNDIPVTSIRATKFEESGAMWTGSGFRKFKGNIIVPEGVTTIEKKAFAMCSEPTIKVVLPSTLTVIEEWAFATSLFNSIVIPNGVTTIGARAFLNNIYLKTMIFPESVTSLGEALFADSNGVKDLTFNSITPPSITETTIPDTVEIIRVPTSSVTAYKTAPIWKKYKDKIQGQTSVYDIEKYANINKVLKHSVGVYDNMQYGRYNANVTDNGDGTMNVDMIASPNGEYISETTDNGDGTMSVNLMNIKEGD